jgi:hypothetical protein
MINNQKREKLTMKVPGINIECIPKAHMTFNPRDVKRIEGLAGKK